MMRNRSFLVRSTGSRWPTAQGGIDSVTDANKGIKVDQSDVIDTVSTTTNTETKILDTDAPGSKGNILGNDFLRNLGVFGWNQ